MIAEKEKKDSEIGTSKMIEILGSSAIGDGDDNQHCIKS